MEKERRKLEAFVKRRERKEGRCITGHAARGVLPDMLLEEHYRTCY